MHATLSVEISVSVLAAHQQGGGFYSDFFAGLDVDRFRFETAALDPALIHSQKHVCPIARLRSTGAGMDGEKRVRAIVLAGKKLAQLELGQLVREPLMLLRYFAFRFAARVGIAFLSGQLLKRFEVVDLALELAKG